MRKFKVVSAVALVSVLAVCHAAHAQAPASHQAAASRHAAGLLMERRGDDRGAFVAFREAAESGHPPAQRKLGEIYDSGNNAVERDFSASIHWYEKAREGGEIIPPPKSPMPVINGP